MEIFRIFTHLKIIAAGGLGLMAGIPICLSSPVSAQSFGSVALEKPVRSTASLRPLISQDWSSIEAAEFRKFSSDYFYILTDDNRPVRLRLLKTLKVDSGPYRPDHLARREGLIAVFNAPIADCNWFIENGHQSVNIWHHALGNGRVFLGAVKNARGQYKIEMILN